ncbi:MAG TPA: BACON domain-containing carbohydrate-binding protein [Bryobacteraceae bacterium]|nr:BACON domain-containing carbohydrate-binding protein [Bryobacteraceae bacterium]
MHRFIPVAILAFTLSTYTFGQSPVVQTFAGGGLPQGVLGTNINLGQPTNLAVDAAGNVYIPVVDYDVVLRLDRNGNLTVVAGNGTRGYSGDGGPAIGAQLSGPLGVAVDSGGNLYIADSGNNVVRKLSNGNITTIAGSGVQGYGGDNGLATAALLNSPSAVAVDGSGTVYIADWQNNRIRKVSSGQIVLFAGNGLAGFKGDNGSAQNAELNAPFSVAVDRAGNVYIADTSNQRIRKVVSGGISTVAGDGLIGSSGDNGDAAVATMNFPAGIALDAAGNIYIADRGNARVRLVTVSTHIMTTVAGTGVAGFGGDGSQASAAQLANPFGVAVDSTGNVYIADRGLYLTNGRLRKVAPGGVITTVAGTGGTGPGGDGGPAASAQLNAPKGLALDATGNVYIADTNDNRVREVTRSTMTPVAGTGIPGYSGDNGSAAAARLQSPASVAVDATGAVYVADAPNNVIRKISNGTIATFAGTGVAGFNIESGNATTVELNQPSAVAVDSAGAVYIADTGNGRIRKVSGGIMTTIGGGGLPGFILNSGPAVGAYLNAPAALAVDANKNVYVADTGNNLVRKIVGFSIDTVAGLGLGGFAGDGGPALGALLNHPSGVAVDTAGNVYIADTNNHRVRKVTSNGLIATIGGTGTAGFGGDDGPATKAQFSGPTGIAVDSAGTTIYIADTGNQRIRVIAPPLSSCSFNLSAMSLQPSAAGGSFSIDIQTGPFCAWTMTGLPTWITVTGGTTSGSGPGTVTLTVAFNSGASRTATISVNGIQLAVNQQSSNGCTYALSPGGQGFSAPGGAGSVAVTAAASCSWTVSGQPSWITIIGAGGGSGNGAVNFVVAANSGAARSATLSFPGVTFLVDQAANSTTGLNTVASMAHLVYGGGWTTTLWLVNPSLTVPAQFRLNLFGDNGNPLVASLSFPQNPSAAGPEIASTIDRTLAPGALLIVELVSAGAQSAVEGWGQVLSNTAIGGSATFRFTAGSLDHMALVPLETRNAAAYLVPFDNTGGFVAGIALANGAIQAGSVGVIVRDDAGAVLLTTTRPLTGFGHSAFVLPTAYAVTAGKRGTVEFDIPFGGAISVLGIQYNNASGGFSTIPALAKQ